MITEVLVDDCDVINHLQVKFCDFLTQKHELIDRFTNNPYMKVYTYTECSNLVGFIEFDYIHDRYELINICVVKDYRCKGIGSALMDFMISKGKEQRIKNITLEVRSDNCCAINLYKKNGFVETAKRFKYYGDTDGILMEKEMM